MGEKLNFYISGITLDVHDVIRLVNLAAESPDQ